ncbi:MAG: T9SS type A sorting domain-containing protein [Bacteroidetes bacterium]|nr:T9SS type A sorting domain-containing protein [Bacteroidota bacterium]
MDNPNFPVQFGKYYPGNSNAANANVGVAEFETDGNLKWISIIGSDGLNYMGTWGLPIDVASNGHIFIASEGEVRNGGDVVTKYKSGAYYDATNTTASGYANDIFIAEFNQNGLLQWSTYFGGNKYQEWVNHLVIDGQDNLYIACTMDEAAPVKTKTGAYNATLISGSDNNNLIAKFNSNGALEWSTGFGEGTITAIDVDDNDKLYIAGRVKNSVPVTTGASQTTQGGGGESFLASFNADNSLNWCTYFGGSGNDYIEGMKVFRNNVWIAGETSGSSSFPTVDDGSGKFYDGSFNGGITSFYKYYGDAFYSVFSLTGNLNHSSYLGSGNNEGLSFIVSDDYNVYIGGHTSSNNLTPFPFVSGGQSNSLYLDDTRISTDIADGYIAAFNGNIAHKWGTYYGGEGEPDEILRGERIGNAFFATAYTANPASKLDLVRPSSPNGHFKNNQSSGALILKFDLTNTSLGTKEQMAKDNRAFEIYPNPATNQINLAWQSKFKGRIELRTLDGKILKVDDAIEGMNHSLDVSHLSSGIYVVIVSNNEMTHVQKVSISK